MGWLSDQAGKLTGALAEKIEGAIDGELADFLGNDDDRVADPAASVGGYDIGENANGRQVVGPTPQPFSSTSDALGTVRKYAVPAVAVLSALLVASVAYRYATN